MGFLYKLFGKGKPTDMRGKDAAPKAAENETVSIKDERKLSSKDIIQMMLMMAEAEMEKGEYANAVDQYKQILQLEPNETAQYNLGSLYAQGKGAEQNFMEGAYWFHQAERSGNEKAGKLCKKCEMDFVHQNFDSKTPEQLYTDMMRFMKYVYPEKTNANLEACRSLFGIAGNHFNKKEHGRAAKLLRAAAEFGNDGYSQNYLAVLYNAGAGIEKNDLAALYWFDRAVDSGAADVALTDRDGLLNAYRTNFSAVECYEEIMKLSGWCSMGSKDVPKDATKSAYWRAFAENSAKAATEKGE